MAIVAVIESPAETVPQKWPLSFVHGSLPLCEMPIVCSTKPLADVVHQAE
jgi:hypothetical protein